MRKFSALIEKIVRFISLYKLKSYGKCNLWQMLIMAKVFMGSVIMANVFMAKELLQM